MYTEHDVRQLHLWMQSQLAPLNASIDAFYFCPHHRDGDIASLSFDCPYRKPQPGMLLAAARHWNINLKRSIMLGDKPRDMGAAKNAQVYGITVDHYTLAELTRMLETYQT